MENIYKIKIRSIPNPCDLYPSERRYSSSIVLGLSFMFLALAATSSLMGSLVVHKITTNNTHGSSNVTYNDTEMQRFLERIEADLRSFKNFHAVNIPALVCTGTFLMALGQLVAGLAGLIAWKHWYIDNNITWFFVAGCFSSVTSSLSLLIIGLALADLVDNTTAISLGLGANILIVSLLGVVWSLVASNVAYKGMNNSYPDDVVVAKNETRCVEKCTVRKGNKLSRVVTPDTLNHFPKSGKKFFHKKKTNGDLPQAESNKEYEERVKKFLSESDSKD